MWVGGQPVSVYVCACLSVCLYNMMSLELTEERRRKINYDSSHIFSRLISVFLFFLLSASVSSQGYLLAHNQQQGVIISNHSLVIQGVSRTTAGNYSCVGFNAEGQGTSPPFQLNVLCKCSGVIHAHRVVPQSPFTRTPARAPEKSLSTIIILIAPCAPLFRCTHVCTEPGPHLRYRET